LKEEMGFECPLRPVFTFTYRAPLDHGLTEHELDHVLTGSYGGTPRPDPGEVDQWRAVPVDQLHSDLAAQPDKYSVWLQPALEGLLSRGLLPLGKQGEGGIPVSAERTHTEEHKIPGDKLLSRIKELVHQGNIRRVSIKNDEGQILLEIPLTLGVVGMALMPVWIAIGAMAAYAANYTIVVEKTDK
jgi:hypothetical protein